MRSTRLGAGERGEAETAPRAMAPSDGRAAARSRYASSSATVTSSTPRPSEKSAGVEDPQVRVERGDRRRRSARRPGRRAADRAARSRRRPRRRSRRRRAGARSSLGPAEHGATPQSSEREERRMRGRRDELAAEDPDVGVGEAVTVGDQVRLQVVVAGIGQAGERRRAAARTPTRTTSAPTAIAASHQANRRSAPAIRAVRHRHLCGRAIPSLPPVTGTAG